MLTLDAHERNASETIGSEAKVLETGPESIRQALETAEARLFDLRDPARGHWRGTLSASALSTATASFALLEIDCQSGGGQCADGQRLDRRALARRGLDWLATHANDDGGWGDTVRSQSNLSTTMLCWAALAAGADTLGSTEDSFHGKAIARAREWIVRRTGSLEPAALKTAIEGVYGEDRTFSIPILTLCSLAGVLGPRAEAFRGITRLPFELAALPQGVFRFVGLPVVSYALPALIAVGQVQHHHHPPSFGPLRALRQRFRPPTLARLTSIQPTSGGFLEAIPLTSFVAMSLAGAGEAGHPVVEAGEQFLAEAVSDDGSWPIDIDLATWVTTLSIQGLTFGQTSRRLDSATRDRLLAWLLGQQYQETHPYTGAAPGGWAWTDLPGGVPDADDTAGALLALRALCDIDNADGGSRDEAVLRAAENGLEWLLGLQNRDGGIPTFCRGWGKLPFDRSAPDLSAHALRAIAAWRHDLARGSRKQGLVRRLDRARERLYAYLARTQRPDGAWIPLWFGNEAARNFENPTYGTARTLRALENLPPEAAPFLRTLRDRGEAWLLAAQNADGGWGGDTDIVSSVEETALAIEALAVGPGEAGGDAVSESRRLRAVAAGAAYLAHSIDQGALEQPTPIGFYFANLWYFEALYPIVFSIAALRRALASAEAASD